MPSQPNRLPLHLLTRREKVYCNEPRARFDREAKVQIEHLARVMKHKTERGKHYGVLTGKFVDCCTRCCG